MFRTSNYVTRQSIYFYLVNKSWHWPHEINTDWASFKLHNTFRWDNDDARFVLDQHALVAANQEDNEPRDPD